MTDLWIIAFLTAVFARLEPQLQSSVTIHVRHYQVPETQLKKTVIIPKER